MRFPIPPSLILAAGIIALACSSKSSLTIRPDGAISTDARVAVTGGTIGPKMDGSAGSASGGATTGATTGGAPGTGGMPGSGGVRSTGGAFSTGGSPGTGGTRNPDDAAVSDASSVETGCSCSRALSWECYCSAYSCSAKLSDYQPDGGLPTNVRAIRAYADCNLVVVTYKIGYDPEISKVFDLVTGALVGDQKAGDTPMTCPFGDGGTVLKLSAGIFPASSCKITQCTVGPVGGPYCGSGGSGGSGGGGAGGGG